MGNTYTNIAVHYVFATKQRVPKIAPEFMGRLWAYIGGIAKTNGMTPLAIGGTTNHIHALIVLPPALSISKGAQLIKGGSSKWLNDNYFLHRTFRWQKGYAAFSVSESKVPAVLRYIKNQRGHHRIQGFQEEYLQFLKANNISYDERYVFD